MDVVEAWGYIGGRTP